MKRVGSGGLFAASGVTLFRRQVVLTMFPAARERAEDGGDALERAARGPRFEDGLDISSLDCAFRVKKDLRPEPNSAEIRVYNLSEDSRDRLSTQELFVRLEAGYVGAMVQIYEGRVRSAETTIEGSDVITNVSTGDSEKQLATSRFSLSVANGTPIRAVLEALVAALGVGKGNTDAAASRLAAKGVREVRGATAFSGAAKDTLNAICRSYDLEWSIQDGVIQFLERGQALEELGPLLSAQTGLIGSPTIDHKGVLTARALIQPGLEPGKLFTLEGARLQGGYRVEYVEYSGDMRGQEWYATVHAKVVK